MTSPIETNNVVERLKKRKRVLYDDDTLRYAFELINPDGPDAVKVIQSLSDRIDVLEAECERAWEAYRIAHDQAMSNGQDALRFGVETRVNLARTQNTPDSQT